MTMMKFKEMDSWVQLIKPNEADAPNHSLTTFVRGLAVRVRQYNASLYDFGACMFTGTTGRLQVRVIWPEAQPSGINLEFQIPNNDWKASRNDQGCRERLGGRIKGWRSIYAAVRFRKGDGGLCHSQWIVCHAEL